MVWGQLVVGPPGSGKTTYCNALHEYLNSNARYVYLLLMLSSILNRFLQFCIYIYFRPAIIINLDPANENLPYEPTIDVCDLISLPDVMDEFHLGPNGGLIYCIEYLEGNLSWLEGELEQYIEDGYYLIFDCPGQAELYTVHDGFSRIVSAIQKWDIRLVCVHLMDSYQCTDPAKFISASLNAMQAMIRLELPHLNVLSKVDLEENFRAGGEMFSLENYTDLEGLHRLLPPADLSDSDDDQIESDPLVVAEKLRLAGREDLIPEGSESTSAVEVPHNESDKKSISFLTSSQLQRCAPRTSAFLKKFRSLNERIVELLEEYSLVSYLPMSVKSPLTMGSVLKAADKAIGFVSVRTKASERLLSGGQLSQSRMLEESEEGDADLFSDILPNRELPGERELVQGQPRGIPISDTEIEGSSTRVSDIAELLKFQGKL